MADVSVRPALPSDAGRIGAIHAATMRLAVEAGLGALPPGLDATLAPAARAERWGTAIAAPPSPSPRVLAALEGNAVVGFPALAPAEPIDGAPAHEIVALEVAPDRTRAGHGSRLLAACVDVLRQLGAPDVLVWCVRGDEPRTRFLSSAGFAPLGVRRSFDVAGSELVQLAWHAGLA